MSRAADSGLVWRRREDIQTSSTIQTSGPGFGFTLLTAVGAAIGAALMAAESACGDQTLLSHQFELLSH